MQKLKRSAFAARRMGQVQCFRQYWFFSLMTVLKGTFFPIFLSVIGEQNTSHGTRNYRFYWRGNRAIRAETKDPIHASLLPEIQHVKNKAILWKKPPASKNDNNNADNKISCPIFGRASQWYVQYNYYWDSESLYNQLWLLLYILIVLKPNIAIW